MAAPKVRCPVCGSDNIRRRFLGIPKVFGCSPAFLAGIFLFGSLGLLVDLLSGFPPATTARDEWFMRVTVIILSMCIVVISFLAKNHRCLTCRKRFNWPPLSPPKFDTACPKCGAQLTGLTQEAIGNKETCPSCSHVFEIQRPSDK